MRKEKAPDVSKALTNGYGFRRPKHADPAPDPDTQHCLKVTHSDDVLVFTEQDI
jgi:hypothetical protein